MPVEKLVEWLGAGKISRWQTHIGKVRGRFFRS